MAIAPKASELLKRTLRPGTWKDAVEALDPMEKLPLQDGLYVARIDGVDMNVRRFEKENHEPYDYVEVVFIIHFYAKVVSDLKGEDLQLTVLDKRREGDKKAGRDFRIDQCIKRLQFGLRETENSTIIQAMLRVRRVLECFLNMDSVASGEEDFDKEKHLFTFESALAYIGNWNPWCLCSYKVNGAYENVDVRQVLLDEEVDGVLIANYSRYIDAVQAILGYEVPGSDDARAIAADPFLAERFAQEPQTQIIDVPTQATQIPSEEIPFDTGEEEEGEEAEGEWLDLAMSRDDAKAKFVAEKKFQVEQGKPVDTLPKLLTSMTTEDILRAIVKMAPDAYSLFDSRVSAPSGAPASDAPAGSAGSAGSVGAPGKPARR